MQLYPHDVPSHVAALFGRTAHAAHEAPHVLTLPLLTQAPPQRWNPALHAKAHVPAVQDAVAFAGAVHTVEQVPQCVTSPFVLISHPSAGSVLQSVYPAAHANPQAVPLQVAEALGGTVHAAQDAPHVLTLELLEHVPEQL